jgi:PleD family two-component response regulator
MKVLIVDDSVIELEIIASTLEAEGFECIALKGHQDAVTFAQEIQPDFIILDLFMPEVNGLEICKQLKLNEKTANIPTMFITASSSAEDIITSMHLGCIDYFHKPLNMADFAKTMREKRYVAQIHDIFTDMKQATKELKRTFDKRVERCDSLS